MFDSKLLNGTCVLLIGVLMPLSSWGQHSRPTRPAQHRGINIGGPSGVVFGGGRGLSIGGKNGVQIGRGRGARFGGQHGVQFGGGRGMTIGNNDRRPDDQVDERQLNANQHPLLETNVLENPASAARITIHYPENAHSELTLQINGTDYVMSPGETIELDGQTNSLVQTGDQDVGVGWALTPGNYQFQQTPRGWSLFRTHTIALPAPPASAPTHSDEPPVEKVEPREVEPVTGRQLKSVLIK